jgi:hypothetical protein
MAMVIVAEWLILVLLGRVYQYTQVRIPVGRLMPKTLNVGAGSAIAGPGPQVAQFLDLRDYRDEQPSPGMITFCPVTKQTS